MLMWIVVGLLVLLGAVLIGGSIWARNLQPDPERYHATEALGVGEYPQPGGLTLVQPVADGPATLARLDTLILATPRTTRLAGSVAEGHLSYITRSALFGFPDVSNVWLGDGTLTLRGHLVVGQSDMGVNAARIRGWRDALQAR